MSPAAPDRADAAEDREGLAAPRVLVVDADDRTRESVVGILGIRHRFEVVGSAASVADAIAIARSARPDVVILDPRLPDLSGGLALIRRINAIDPEIRILAVGWSPDLEHQALTAGADGFVRKTFKPGDLAAGVARCMDRSPGGAIQPADEPDAGLAAARSEPVGQRMSDGPAAPSPDSTPTPVSARGTGLIL